MQTLLQTQTGVGARISYLKLGDTVLELVHRNSGGMKGFHFCFGSDDSDGDVSRLDGAGIPFISPPHDTKAREAREAREKGWRLCQTNANQVELAIHCGL